jgi:hypothetical protein
MSSSNDGDVQRGKAMSSNVVDENKKNTEYRDSSKDQWVRQALINAVKKRKPAVEFASSKSTNPIGSVKSPPVRTNVVRQSAGRPPQLLSVQATVFHQPTTSRPELVVTTKMADRLRTRAQSRTNTIWL